MKEQLEFPMKDHKTTIIVVMLLISIFALSFLTTSPAFSQEVKDTVITEELAANQIINNIVDKATIAVSSIADALKVPAEHVYSVLVKQSVIHSIVNILLSILFIIITIISYKMSIYYYKKHDNDDCEDGVFEYADSGIFCTLSIIMLIVWIIHLLATVNIIITGFINPEYRAIQEILNIF